MEIVSEKYIFAKPCYCFTTFKKNSAWAIEKLCSKTCVRKGFSRVIYTIIARVTQAQFLPRVYTKFETKKSTLVHDYIPGKINHFYYTLAEKNPANSENILKTGHKYYGPPFDLS